MSRELRYEQAERDVDVQDLISSDEEEKKERKYG